MNENKGILKNDTKSTSHSFDLNRPPSFPEKKLLHRDVSLINKGKTIVQTQEFDLVDEFFPSQSSIVRAIDFFDVHSTVRAQMQCQGYQQFLFLQPLKTLLNAESDNFIEHHL